MQRASLCAGHNTLQPLYTLPSCGMVLEYSSLNRSFVLQHRQREEGAMEERLIELETRLAFQEKTLEELNEVVIRQQSQIDLLEKESQRLAAQLRPLLDTAGDSPLA